MEPIICPETAVINYQSTLRNIPEEQKLIYTAAEARNHSISIIICVNKQLDAIFLMCLFNFSMCFEQHSAHHQENKLYQYIIIHMQVKEELSDLHTRRPPTQSDIYQMMY